MFNITQSGNVVNISSDDVIFHITGSFISGTSLMMANIEAEGYDWEVTCSGTTSNIKLIKNMFMSGGYFGANIYGKMLYYPWETGQTMGTIGVTGSLTPTLLTSSTKDILPDNYAHIEMSSNHVFILMQRTEGETVLRWIGISGSPVVDYVNGASENIYSFCAYNDTTAYLVTEEWGDDYDHMILRKVIFEDTGTGTFSTTDVYTWEYSDTYDGRDADFEYLFYLNKVKYGYYDCIVAVMDYYGSAPVTYPCRAIIYNTSSHSTVDTWFEPASYDANISWCWFTRSSPSFYNDKMIFTLPVENWVDIPGVPYDICVLPCFILNITYGTVTRIDDLVRPYVHQTIDQNCSVINNLNTNYLATYYFVAWNADDADYRLYSMDINSPSIVEGNIIGDFDFYQGEHDGYAIDTIPAPGACDVTDIPGMAVLNSVNQILSYKEAACTIDMDNNIMWNLQLDRLEGKDINGGSDRDIMFSVPLSFTYLSNQRIAFRILNGKCVIMIYSRRASPLAFQQEYYLLKEA